MTLKLQIWGNKLTEKHKVEMSSQRFFSWRNGEKEMQSNLSFDRVLQK